MRLLVVSALVLSTFAGTVAAASRDTANRDELRAFKRAQRAIDVLPASLRRDLRMVESRRVATYRDRRGRSAAVYVARGRGRLCVITLQWNGAGAGCSAAHRFLADAKRIAAVSGRLFAGVAANDVSHVVVVGTRGVRHRVSVTPDGGFIFDCRAYNGCTCVLAAVEAYGRDGSLLSSENWRSPSCRP